MSISSIFIAPEISGYILNNALKMLGNEYDTQDTHAHLDFPDPVRPTIAIFSFALMHILRPFKIIGPFELVSTYNVKNTLPQNI
jgi:hypothetical protein